MTMIGIRSAANRRHLADLRNHKQFFAPPEDGVPPAGMYGGTDER